MEQSPLKNNPDIRIMAISVTLIAFLMLCFALQVGSILIMPLVLAIFIFYVISPLVNFFQNHLKIPRVIAVFLCLGAISFFITYVVMYMIEQFSMAMDQMGYYQVKLNLLFDATVAKAHQYGIKLNFEIIRDKMLELPLFNYAKGLASYLMNFFTIMSLVAIYVIFLLLGPIKPSKESDHLSFGSEINFKIKKYIITKIISSLATGVLVGLTLYFLKLDFFLVFTILSMVLNFIPTLGAIVATLLPLSIALLQYDQPMPIILVLALPGAIQFMIGSFIEPKIIGRNLNLHPITILVALIFWGIIWGIPGAFLAVPITAILKIVLERFQGGDTLANLLAGDLESIKERLRKPAD
jgi:AI-2 transport protein TqsA